MYEVVQHTLKRNDVRLVNAKVVNRFELTKQLVARLRNEEAHSA